MMKIVRAMSDAKFKMFYGDYKKICADYKTIRTYSTKAFRENDDATIKKYNNVLLFYKLYFKKNPWENVAEACSFENDVDQEAKRRGIA